MTLSLSRSLTMKGGMVCTLKLASGKQSKLYQSHCPDALTSAIDYLVAPHADSEWIGQIWCRLSLIRSNAVCSSLRNKTPCKKWLLNHLRKVRLKHLLEFCTSIGLPQQNWVMEESPETKSRFSFCGCAFHCSWGWQRRRAIRRC